MTSPLLAQRPQAAGFDIMVGVNSTGGQFIENPRSPLVDMLAAVKVKTLGSWVLVTGAGVAGVLGGNDDSCLMDPNGGCAPKGNFGVIQGFAGGDKRVGESTVRALVGPAHVRGGGHTSFGMQARLDAAVHAGHFGFGVMARGTVLPSHGGERLRMLALGIGVSLR